MRTDELIRQLAADATPLPRGAAAFRLGSAIALGTALSFAVMLASTGPPLQALPSIGGASLAMKLLYSAVLFAVTFALLLAAGKPGRNLGPLWLWLLLPAALIALNAILELSNILPKLDDEQIPRHTWQQCLLTIIPLSAPIFAGVLWAFRRLAPTRLRLAGLLAGVTAGSAAATLYALYCPKPATPSLLLLYSAGALATGLFGALTGPRLLRW